MNVVRSLPLVSPASQHAMYYGGSIATPAQLSLPIFSYREMPRKCAQHFPSFDAVLLEPVASGKQKLPWIATWAVRCRHQTQTEDFRMRWQIQRSSVPFPNLQQCCQTRQYASLPGRSHGSRVRKNTRHFGPLFGKAVVRLRGDRTPHGLNHLFQTIRRQGEGRVPGHAGETTLSLSEQNGCDDTEQIRTSWPAIQTIKHLTMPSRCRPFVFLGSSHCSGSVGLQGSAAHLDPDQVRLVPAMHDA